MNLFKLSKSGAEFISNHEGIVLKAYRDPVGIVTIGTGFTNRSQSFRKYWMTKTGRKLRLGDRMTRDECLKLLPVVADEEYGSAVNKNIKPLHQHHYDAATSMAFNCGPKSTTWRWARALRDGNISRAADLLRTTATTAKGRKLRGLVRRRKEEAELLEHGNYGKSKYPSYHKEGGTRKSDRLLEYQTHLKTLGYYNGNLDGLTGPQTRKAVLEFQKKHPQLDDDGILGKATMAQIDRTIKGMKDINGTTLIGGGATAITGVGEQVVNQFSGNAYLLAGVAILAACGIIYVLWQNRDEMKTYKPRKA